MKRVLVERGMVKGESTKVKRTLITDGSWIRASRSGMLTCEKVSGDRVKKGDVLGVITGPYGDFSVKVKARKEGVLYGHNNQPVVNKGDALFHIGFE